MGASSLKIRNSRRRSRKLALNSRSALNGGLEGASNIRPTCISHNQINRPRANRTLLGPVNESESKNVKAKEHFADGPTDQRPDRETKLRFHAEFGPKRPCRELS